MSDNRLSLGSINLNAGELGSGAPQQDSGSFRILVLSDFTGRENCQRNDASSIATRPFVTIDRDNFEDILGRLDVHLDRTLLTDEGEHVSVKFRSLDDFHPDELFDTLEVFASLRKLRRQLMNPNLCAQAIDEINSWQTGDITLDDDDDDDSATASTEPADTPNQTVDPANVTVDQLFGGELGPTRDELTVQWQQVISDLVAPYKSKPVDPNRDEYVALIDGAIERAMRSLLQHPHFADLERAWRGVSKLAFGLDTSSKLTIQISDISKSEVVEDLTKQDELSQSQLFKRLVEQTVGTPGGKPWTIVIAAYSFTTSDQDTSTIARLAQLAHAGASRLFVDVGGAPESWTDQDRLSETTWPSLQATPSARSVGVFWPQTLLRLPYGKKTSLTERFDFEERDADRSRQTGLLFGHSSMLAALQLGKQFAKRGSFDTTDVMTQEEMPLLVESYDGEAEVRPCGEYLLTDEQIQAVLKAGITPIVSMKGRAEVVIQGMQSLAQQKL